MSAETIVRFNNEWQNNFKFSKNRKSRDRSVGKEFRGNTEEEHHPTALQKSKGILRTAGVREQQKTEDLGLVQQTLEPGDETVGENLCY